MVGYCVLLIYFLEINMQKIDIVTVILLKQRTDRKTFSNLFFQKKSCTCTVQVKKGNLKIRLIKYFLWLYFSVFFCVCVSFSIKVYVPKLFRKVSLNTKWLLGKHSHLARLKIKTFNRPPTSYRRNNSPE